MNCLSKELINIIVLYKENKMLEKSELELFSDVMRFYESNHVSMLQVKAGALEIYIDRKSKFDFSNSEKDKMIAYDSKNVSETNEKNIVTINSPSVGVYYLSPDPQAEPYIHIGDEIKKGDCLGLIEIMKSFNELTSIYDGIIEEILVENGQMIEHNQPLVKIRIG